MNRPLVQYFRRAWLFAALAAFFGAACVQNAPHLVDDDLQVRVAWRTDLTTDRLWELEVRELGQPILSAGGDLLIGASDGWVYRIEAPTGQVTWATDVGGSVDGAAALVSNTVYVGTDEGEVIALDWRHGVELWRFETRGSVETTPTVSGGRLFVPDSDDVLYALDAATGDFLWDYQRRSPEFFTIKGGGQPLAVGNELYAGFADGHLVALYADSGEEIWTVYLGDESGEFGDVDLPISIDDERLVAISHAGGVYGVERDTGALLWRTEIAEVSSAELVGSWLFVTTATGRVAAIDTGEGQLRWEYELDEGAAADLTAVDSFIVVAAAQGPLVWLDIHSGRPVGKWAPSSGFQSAPVFDERQGYVVSNRGYLYGFRLAF